MPSINIAEIKMSLQAYKPTSLQAYKPTSLQAYKPSILAKNNLANSL